MTQFASAGDVAPLNALDRPGEVTQQLLQGDISAAWRAALSPESLTLHERNRLMEKWGIRHDSLAGRAFDTVTNPMVLTTMALTFAFPIPTARNLFKVKKGVEGMLNRIPVMRGLTGVRGAFRGTPVPDILDDMARGRMLINETYLEGMLGPAFNKFQQAVGRMPNAKEQASLFMWLQKAHVKPLQGWDDLGVLFPHLERTMSEPLRALGRDVRATLDHTIENVFNNPDNRKWLLATVKRMKRLGYDNDEMDAIASLLEKGGYKGLPDYVPHRVVRTQADIKRLQDAVAATVGQDAFRQQAQLRPITFLGREFYRRKGAMVPHMQEIALLEDAMAPGALARLHAGVKDKLIEGLETAGVSSTGIRSLKRRTLSEILEKGANTLDPGDAKAFTIAVAEHMPKQYSLRLEPVLQHYYHSVGTTYAWSARGNGPRFLEQVQRAKLLGRANAQAAWRARMLEDTVLPSALGRPTPRQAMNAQIWDQRWGSMLAQLDRPSVRGVLGDQLVDGLQEMHRNSLGMFSLRGFSHKVASYFYASTLSANPAAAFKNNFQTILTTSTLVGAGRALHGQLEVLKRSGTYFAARFDDKLAHTDALKKAFPEFAEAGLSASPLTDEALGRAFEAAYRVQATAPLTVSTVEKINRGMMSMFTASETNVRLTALYAGLKHAADDGITGAAAIRHARRVVEQTQFVPGLVDTPMHLLPGGVAANPLIRQLAQFPLKFTEFTLDGVRKAMAGDPSQISRQIAFSYVTMEAGEMLGVNTGDALIGNAIPAFTSVDERGTILAPLPIVPPAASVIGAVASGLGSGDWETFRRQLPLLVPGGIGAARAAGFVPGGQPVAEAVNRKYADYANRDPATGRIPVYTGAGNLVGYYKPWELFRHAIGLKGGAMDEEIQLANRLRLDTAAIKAARKEYLTALFANDPRKMSRIEGEYRRRFGHDLTITRDQVRQTQKRRMMTRVERQLQTLPAAARPQYEQAAFGGEHPASRMSRAYGGHSAPSRMTPPPPNYTNDLDPMSELDVYEAGQRRSVPEGFP